MTTKIEFAELPATIAASYNPIDVRKVTRRTNKYGTETYRVEMYRGTLDAWRLEATSAAIESEWVKYELGEYQ